jgi:hypothetical protein
MTYVRVHLVLYGEKGPSVGASSTYPKASDILGMPSHLGIDML